MAITAASSQVTATQLEQVRQKFAKFLTMAESDLAKKFTVTPEKHRVSAWNAGSNAVLAWRIPVLVSIGGDYQAISLDGGDMGTGSMMNTAYMTIGYFANDIGYNIPSLSIMATKSQQQAMSNTLQFNITNAVKETALYNEIGLFGDGTGILATANGTGSPVISGGKVTYNLETTDFLYDRIRGAGQLVDIYNASNVLQFSGARVSSIGFSLTAPTITLSGVSTYTPANTDKIAFPNMGTGSYTAAAGSWRYGIYTFNTTNTTGSLLGLTYASVYELATPTVNGGGGYFTPSVAYSGKSQLTQRRDEDAMKGLIGVCHMAQRTAWYQQGVTIANQFIRPGEAAKSMDLAGQGTDYNDRFRVADVDHYVSRYADKSRVDWLNPSNFGWVQLDDINFFSSPDGQRTFVGRSSTTGNPQAGFQFYVINSRNLYSVDPGCAVEFYNLSIPSGQ
jgi:hypothetical protein